MVEFFQNIFSWFSIHKDEIVLVFTSTNFASFVTAIVLFIKQFRANEDGKNELNTIMKTLSKLISLASDVSSVATKVTDLDNKVTTLEQKVDESFCIIQGKLDAMLDVQSIVYANIKDETARKNVSNILVSARLIETATKADLQKQIDELKTLKEEIASKVSDVKAIADKVNASSTTTVSTKSVTPRY